MDLITAQLQNASICAEKPLDVEKESRDYFDETFESSILASVSVHLFDKTLEGNVIEDTLDWLKNVMRRNVPDGKQRRGRIVEFVYKQLRPDATQEDQNRAIILGWCVEILRAGYVVAEDIMYSGVTRRGRPCWYREDGMHNIAFNDALMLEHVAYQLLQKYFSHLSMHGELMNIFHRVSLQTTLGQSLDTRSSKTRDFEKFSESTYYSIAQFKTAYYTCFLPIALAMSFAGYSQKEEKYKSLWEKVEKISVKMGILFQVQNDFMNYSSKEEELGKRGTDIEDGKCTWLFVTAKKMSDAHQLKTLLTNYGHQNAIKVAEVRLLYKKLNIQKEFQRFRERYRTYIASQIEGIELQEVRSVLQSVLQMIKRW